MRNLHGITGEKRRFILFSDAHTFIAIAYHLSPSSYRFAYLNEQFAFEFLFKI